MRYLSGIAAAALGVFVLAANAPAKAQCFGCNRYDQGRCVEYRTCTPGVPGSSGPSASYGAIAYGRTSKAWGYSYRWGSRAKAERAAMKNCAQHGNDCEVMVWFNRKCGAVASGDGTDAFWGLGDSEAQARASAQKECEKGGSTACEVQVAHCSN
jgi:hypothetical protein